MRKKIVSQRKLFDQSIDLLISIFEPDRKLKNMDSIIDANPEILDAVHASLNTDKKLFTGRNGISAERVLRCAILKQLKQYSYRELAERIHDGISYRWFTRFHSDNIPHFTALQKAIKSLSNETWSKINSILVEFSKRGKVTLLFKGNI